MEAENIAKKARKSISQFCFEECNAYCCRKGYLLLTKKELDLVAGKKQIKIQLQKDNKYSLFLGDTCPSLQGNFKCKIHRNRNRPQACKEFPIFIYEKNIILSGRCLAVKQGKFYPYIKQWLKLGYKIHETDSLEGWEL